MTDLFLLRLRQNLFISGHIGITGFCKITHASNAVYIAPFSTPTAAYVRVYAAAPRFIRRCIVKAEIAIGFIRQKNPSLICIIGLVNRARFIYSGLVRNVYHPFSARIRMDVCGRRRFCRRGVCRRGVCWRWVCWRGSGRLWVGRRWISRFWIRRFRCCRLRISWRRSR